MIVLFAVTQYTMYGLLSMEFSFATSVFVVFVILIYAIVLAIKVGQSGSRLKGKAIDGTVINREDDRYWRAGMFYYNKEDASMFVEKRIGVGFTLNFARPLAIILFVGLLLFIIGVSVITSLTV